ncbi:MAG: PrsW family intramembrane metalloprotease [Labilithrix sp.]|nr:PrsW family intramembrane metalloprotease [Labilithrix sp.]
MRARGLLFTPYGEPRLLVPGLVGVLSAFVIALALITFTNRPRTEEERADNLMRSARPAAAEQIYARLLREQPSVSLALSLLEAHDRARLLEKIAKLRAGEATGLPDDDAPMSEEELDRLVAELPEDVALVARFARGVNAHAVPIDVHEKISERARREPPAPWANHMLGREAQREGRHEDAAGFYEKEGVTFAERRADVDTALLIWLALEDWDTLRDRLADDRVAAAAGPLAKYKLAVHDGDWRAAARWLPGVWAPRLGGTGLVMSAISALGWAFFCARLGKLGARVRFRLPMYVVAFALGVASVVPTVLLIAVEEARFKIVETGDPARDVLFFVFGVGLREEASKLLLFLPLLPLLRRWGDKLDVLVCGALVGLGFAAEENLNYLAQENLQTGLGRFLTANFFHMASTGTLASALDDFVADRERHAAAFMRTSLFVVAIHGAYDFLLSHEEYGGTYFAMTAFVLLTKLFLEAVESARRRADRGLTPLHAFIFAVAIVTGVSLAFGTMAVGPKQAFIVMGSGLLGQAIIVYMFVRTLRTM